MEYHMTYWREVRDEAADALARICDCSVPETDAEVEEILSYVICHGNPLDQAKAITAASEWVHAENELTYKKRQREDNKPKEVHHDHA